MKRLTFAHRCMPITALPKGCPVVGTEVSIEQETIQPDGTAFVMPEVRCAFTNSVLPLVAIDYNRNI